MYFLAKELNVSVATISRAFDPNSKVKREKRELILETAKKYNYTPNVMASRLSMEKIRIGILNYSYIKAYYNDILSGIKAAHAAFKDYKIDYDLYDLRRSEHTLEQAFSVIDEFETKKYDAVIISGIFEKEITGKINSLVEKGIITVTLQYDIADSKRLFSSIVNTRMSGEIAAQLSGIFLRNKKNKKVVLFTGNLHTPTHINILKTFREFAPRYGITIADVYETKDIPELAEKYAAQALSRHPDLDAIYCTSANSIPVCRYLDSQTLGDEIVLIASDVFPELIPYLENGVVDATIYHNPYQMGYSTFETLVLHLLDGSVPSKVLTSNPQIVLKSNLPLYLK